MQVIHTLATCSLDRMADLLRKPYVPVSIALLLVVGYVLVTNSDPIVNGHPSYVVMYSIAIVAAFAGITIGVVRRNTRSRLWLAILASLPILLLVLACWLLSPFAATDAALDALMDSETVVVEQSSTWITLRPTGDPGDVGFIFQPGGRVDSRAYARILRPLAEAEFPVVIVKQPLGIAFLASGFAGAWVDDHPDMSRWVASGHSLGGVVASSNAADDPDIDGLALWASFPRSDISGTTNLAVVSVYGTNDGLSSPSEVLASADDLPSATVFVAVEGAVHAFFGDYGEQPGDGEPISPRDQAQAEIVTATIEFLSALTATQ